MATRGEYNQLQAFARVDGALIALLWILSFACFVGQFKYYVLGTAAFVIGVISLLAASLRVIRFRDRVRDGAITFGQAFAFGVMLYLYASLLFAFAQFIYFQFIDGGFLMSRFTEVVATDEYKQMMQIYGLTEDDLHTAMDSIASMRPVETAMQFFTVNVFMGVCISLPIAVIAKRSKKKQG